MELDPGDTPGSHGGAARHRVLFSIQVVNPCKMLGPTMGVGTHKPIDFFPTQSSLSLSPSLPSSPPLSWHFHLTYPRPSPSLPPTLPRYPPPLLAGPAPIPMAGREMYAPEGLSARSGLPARLSPSAPAKRNNPPERGVRPRPRRIARPSKLVRPRKEENKHPEGGTFEDEKGGYRC